MADVFVSYDRRDRDIAEKVVAALTEQGLTVWWDDRITPHETWDKTIEREVDSAKRVLVLWTNNSVQSDWVRTEAGAAKESTPPKLIQARFSDCKVPLAFRLLQHVDLIGWTPKRRHSGWDRLITWLKDGLDQPAAPAPGGGGPIPPEPEPVAPAEAAPVEAEAPPVTPPPAPAPAPAPQEARPLGLGSFEAAEAPAEPSAARSTGPIPRIEMPKIGTGSGGGAGIDKRLIFGGIGAVALIAVVAALAIGLSRGGGGGGGFSGEERRTLGGYLDGYAETYAPGLSAVGDDVLVGLAQGGTHEYQVQLDEGRSYRVLGACDTGCRNVDLHVEGPDGSPVGSDTLTDDYPVVEVPTAEGGDYTIRISMPGCGAESCIGAARVYAVD